jgi:hypothetical protein
MLKLACHDVGDALAGLSSPEDVAMAVAVLPLREIHALQTALRLHGELPRGVSQ